MRFFRATSPFIFVASAMVAGCGGHGGGGGHASSGGATFAASNSFTLRANVVELDKTATVVASVTSDTVVLTGAPALTPGQILIHNAADATRFLRKVVSATVSGGTTTVTTTDAAATDVFEKANIAQNAWVSQADLLKLQPADDGVTFTAPDAGKAQTRDNIPSINLNFANFQVKDGSGNVIADVSGTVNLAAGVQTIWRQTNALSLPYEAGVSGIAQVNGTLTAHARASGTFSKEVPVSFSLPLPITPLGPLGVNLNLQMLMKVDGTYTASGQFVATASASATAGVHYDTTNHWQFNSGFDKSFNLTPPSVRGSLQFGVSLIRPSISADILGLGEAHVKADVIKAIAEIDGQTSPPGFLVQGYGDFGYTVGGSLHIGPWTLWSDERSYDLGRFSIVKPFLLKTLAPTDSQIVYAETNRSKLHAQNGDGSGDRVLYTAPVAVYDADVSNANKKICFIDIDKASYAFKLKTITPDGKTLSTVNVGSLSPNRPSWSPDGTEIAFDARDSAGAEQVYVVNLSSGKVRQLTNDTTSTSSGGVKQSGFDSEPRWSADGTLIYYSRLYYGVTSVSTTSSAKSTYGVALANDTLSYSDPCLSPDGSLLVARRSDKGIVLASASGLGEHVIVASTIYSHPHFSPDSTSIVVQEDDTNQIVSFDINGGTRKTLASGSSPAWGAH